MQNELFVPNKNTIYHCIFILNLNQLLRRTSIKSSLHNSCLAIGFPPMPHQLSSWVIIIELLSVHEWQLKLQFHNVHDYHRQFIYQTSINDVLILFFFTIYQIQQTRNLIIQHPLYLNGKINIKHDSITSLQEIKSWPISTISLVLL